MGKFFINLMACFAELERTLLQERTRAGVASGREQGRIGGRPKGLSVANERKAMSAYALAALGEMTPKEICEQLGISKTTYYKYLKHVKKQKAVRETPQNKANKRERVLRTVSKQILDS